MFFPGNGEPSRNLVPKCTSLPEMARICLKKLPTFFWIEKRQAFAYRKSGLSWEIGVQDALGCRNRAMMQDNFLNPLL